MTDAELAREQFCKRFKARMLARCGEKFEDGTSIAEYADETAPAYFDDPGNGGAFMETPEDCADTDISYWED